MMEQKHIEWCFEGQLKLQSGEEAVVYGVDLTTEKNNIQYQIRSHKGGFESFPANLTYVRHMSALIPLFKETPNDKPF